MSLKIVLSILFLIISLPFIIFGIKSKKNIYANIGSIVVGTILLITSLIILVM